MFNLVNAQGLDVGVAFAVGLLTKTLTGVRLGRIGYCTLTPYTVFGLTLILSGETVPLGQRWQS